MTEDVKKVRLAALRQQLAALESGGKAAPVLPFGVAAMDGGLPWGGLPLGALHEVGGIAPEAEDGAR